MTRSEQLRALVEALQADKARDVRELVAGIHLLPSHILDNAQVEEAKVEVAQVEVAQVE